MALGSFLSAGASLIGALKKTPSSGGWSQTSISPERKAIGKMGTDLAKQLKPGADQLIGGIGGAYNKYRGVLPGVQSGVMGEFEDVHARKPLWGAIETGAAFDALTAGSPREIARQRGLARDDAQASLRANFQANQMQNLASGLPSPAANANLDRYSHLFGAAENAAGERERRLGMQMRQGLLPEVANQRNLRLAGHNVPLEFAGMEANSYAAQGQAIHQALAPYLDTLSRTAEIYSGSTTTGDNFQSRMAAHNAQIGRYGAIADGIGRIGGLFGGLGTPGTVGQTPPEVIGRL